ncbi:hypothetical protein OAN21_03000 [Alphaproteobacteria bacterium]|nr:hypothetical protein [Alphaproteobacteria bacterium]
MNRKQTSMSQDISRKPANILENEFSRLLDIKKLAINVTSLKLSATEGEKIDLAKRLGVVEIRYLEILCKIENNPSKKNIEVIADVSAHVVQSCSITMEEMNEKIKERVTLSVFISEADMENLPENFEEDLEEIVLEEDGTVDLGEIFVQYLSLAVDPYPKSKSIRGC